MATIALQPGLNPVQTGVDFAVSIHPRRIAFLLFGKHLEQTLWVAHAFARFFGEAWGMESRGGFLLFGLGRNSNILPASAHS
jgi:hypothetical protein